MGWKAWNWLIIFLGSCHSVPSLVKLDYAHLLASSLHTTLIGLPFFFQGGVICLYICMLSGHQYLEHYIHVYPSGWRKFDDKNIFLVLVERERERERECSSDHLSSDFHMDTYVHAWHMSCTNTHKELYLHKLTVYVVNKEKCLRGLLGNPAQTQTTNHCRCKKKWHSLDSKSNIWPNYAFLWEMGSNSDISVSEPGLAVPLVDCRQGSKVLLVVGGADA